MEFNPYQPQKNGMAVAALVCGILGVAGSFTYFTLPLAILGIVFGVKGRRIPVGRGMATAGLVCGIVGVVCSGIVIVCVIGAVGVGALASMQ